MFKITSTAALSDLCSWQDITWSYYWLEALMDFLLQVSSIHISNLGMLVFSGNAVLAPVENQRSQKSHLTAQPFQDKWKNRSFFPISPRLCVLKWKNPLFFPFRDTRWPRLAHHNLQSIALSRAFFVNADKLPRALNSPGALKATPLTLRTLWWAIIRALLRCYH